ncbi:LysR family transcriptional regulator [Diaminobutyricibacter tongyongensis]|uniref:LysR family transcriptional regulator n=1 Tax=Leifsonia tongyongensis TaxID=1268043 RepID=A0A6L9XWB4_9MICO|nr:LysR substrate-binding domain-containing protein [Diaminobutyricibacter tongyongensis]NEN05721.1 LysR family transcriptional regulator [Diaminobutyricibacter tongyongensis]
MQAEIDLESLRLLVRVAAVGALSAVAREAGVSQQAVSSRMAALESHLGVRLLDRTPRGTRLTDEGVLVAEWAAPLLAEADRFASVTRALRATSETHIRIAASMTIAEHLAPGWLVALRAAQPSVRIELVAANSATVAELIRAGSADLGFIETPEIPDDLEQVTFATDELVIVVGSSHPWARRRSGVTVGELAATALIARERGSGTRLAFEQAVASAGHTPAEPAIELSTTTAIRSTAASGAAPAVLSILAVRDQLTDGSLVKVRLRDLRIVRPLVAVWRPDIPPRSPAAAALMTLVRSGLPRPPG